MYDDTNVGQCSKMEPIHRQDFSTMSHLHGQATVHLNEFEFTTIHFSWGFNTVIAVLGKRLVEFSLFNRHTGL